ncbi:outer membrane protein assembly factor BamB family protein [Pedobacter duraquae]|uniref:Outer membrane protein assembly factor BamB n=1 Tax=Pedobacter duraquae TaxID=425511 RepID=A0A4R6IHU7_9SPHI|nr:PQQ-binding-like beta-propeller repeat protein [Pedobacter duraquae]TDO21305.1 outer membrane protein assembly factor BamB [Pedobacter duraquae]
MKRNTLLLLTVLTCCNLVVNAQFGMLKSLTGGGKAGKKSGNFKSVWESEFDNKASRLALSNADGSIIIGTDDNSATVLNTEGKQVWSGDYKKLTTNKTNNSEFQYVIRGDKSGYLFLFDARSMGTDRVAVLDLTSGKELWNSEAYQDLLDKKEQEADIETVKYINELDAFLIAQRGGISMVEAQTGKQLWTTKTFKGSVGKYIYDKKTNQIVMLNYKPTFWSGLFSAFKNQIVKINALNGQIIWDTEFRGTIDKKLITREPLLDLTVKGDKLFLWLDGLQAFDLNTGKKLWEVAYENDTEQAKKSILGIGGRGSKGVYGALAEPLFTNDAVYLAMFANSSKSKYIEKHDLNTGKLIWTSEKITGAYCLPHMYLTGDKIMVQVGGKVEVQEISTRRGANGMITTYKIFNDYVNQKNGLLALNESSGQTAWRSDKFDKRITDMVIHENKTVFAGDGDEFFAYDIASGQQKFAVKHNDAKVGKATDVIDFGDDVVVISEKGLASYKKADGTRNYATAKLSEIDYYYLVGDNYFLRSQNGSKNTIYGINMTNGEVKGSVTSKGKGGSPRYGDGIDITDDGEYIFAFNGKKVEKIKVNN